ncbi:hypothetical protein [uncultured Microbacterium sp.]|uniref:hypothetical protein n=1 Tax=uncultured Microbacterium sp. TaxID=191216 RepID=UPI0025FE383C|nr:hypothetical protein [uncultured Microbacterium sp.]
MGADFYRQPTKTLEREFKALGGRKLEQTAHGARYRFPDGGTHVVPNRVSPGKAQAILEGVQKRYGVKDRRSSTDPLRSAVTRDDPPTIDPDSLSMSRHANERFTLMSSQVRLARAEVTDALLWPERVMWSPLHESWMWVRGRLIVAAAINDDGSTVIRTILWATEDLWEQNPRPPKGDEAHG